MNDASAGASVVGSVGDAAVDANIAMTSRQVL